MRSFLFIATLTLAGSFHTLAQNRVDVVINPYNTSDIGTFQSLGVRVSTTKDYSLRLQLTYHNNKIELPDRNQRLYLHKRFRAFKPIEFVGLLAGVERDFHLFNPEKLRTFVFAETTLRKIGASSYRWIPIDTVMSGNDFYVINEKRHTEIRDLVSLDNIIGLGLEVKMFNQFYFSNCFGIGGNLLFNIPDYISTSKVVLQRSVKYNIGVVYKIKRGSS